MGRCNMPNNGNSKLIRRFGYLLIFFSLTIIFYGLFLQLFEIYQGKSNLQEDNNSDDLVIHIDKPDNDKKRKTSSISNTDYSTVDLDAENDRFRKEIQNKYGIQIMYGSETDGYTVDGVQTIRLNDSNIIHDSLFRLEKCLEKYPFGMFEEIKAGGIPLTILLVDSYSDSNITGVTDSSYRYAKISLATSYPLEESFFHESYHYIERYLVKEGANFNSWNNFNPFQFEYGKIYGLYSYSNTFSSDAFFVNNYAQTMDTEDRASTFEYMMGDEKISCFNNGQIVWKKAITIARTIEFVLDSVSSSTIEYWERFL